MKSWVREVCFTARNFKADEAQSVGLVSLGLFKDKQSLYEGALKLAHSIALKSPVAVRGTKRMLLHARDHSVSEGLDYVAVWNSVMLQAEDMSIAAQASFTKSKPVFSKL
jgi:enoyl-CoA hydratase/carnithine racemase